MKLIRGIGPIVLSPRNLSILLIEDNLALQVCVKTMLESMGCHVTQASSCTEALEKYTSRFDGILTDVGLPDGNGFDFIREIRHGYPNCSAVIYVYTAFDRDYIEEEYSKSEVNGFISKPFLFSDMQRFVEAVKNEKNSSIYRAHRHSVSTYKVD